MRPVSKWHEKHYENSTKWGRNCFHVKNICGFRGTFSRRFPSWRSPPFLEPSINHVYDRSLKNLAQLLRQTIKSIRSPWSNPFCSQWKQNCSHLVGGSFFFVDFFFFSVGFVVNFISLGVGYQGDLILEPCCALVEAKSSMRGYQLTIYPLWLLFLKKWKQKIVIGGKGTRKMLVHFAYFQAIWSYLGL